MAHAAESGEPAGIPDAPSKETPELFEVISARGGPSYEASYDAAIAAYVASHQALSNWSPAEFAGVATAAGEGVGVSYSFAPTSAEDQADVEVSELLKEDAKRLSSYGWNAERGAPAPQSYYTHAKAPSEVMTSEEWVKAE